jgi:hypothetical protein
MSDRPAIREWGPLERAANALRLDSGSDKRQVLHAIAAYCDQGKGDLEAIQIARRCRLPVERVEVAVAELIAEHLVEVGYSRRPGADRYRVLLEPLQRKESR